MKILFQNVFYIFQKFYFENLVWEILSCFEKRILKCIFINSEKCIQEKFPEQEIQKSLLNKDKIVKTMDGGSE